MLALDEARQGIPLSAILPSLLRGHRRAPAAPVARRACGVRRSWLKSECLALPEPTNPFVAERASWSLKKDGCSCRGTEGSHSTKPGAASPQIERARLRTLPYRTARCPAIQLKTPGARPALTHFGAPRSPRTRSSPMDVTGGLRGAAASPGTRLRHATLPNAQDFPMSQRACAGCGR